MERRLTLREASILAETSPHDAALFLPGDASWALETPCAILAGEPPDDGEGGPPAARQRGLKRALGVAEVQDIIANARAQVAEPTPEQLLAAFPFYHERDAFIMLDEG